MTKSSSTQLNKKNALKKKVGKKQPISDSIYPRELKTSMPPTKGAKKAPLPKEKIKKTELLEIDPLDVDDLLEDEHHSSPSSPFSVAGHHPGEISGSFKNFRHHPDMENFYRFIYENDLRYEALSIIDSIMKERQQKKSLKSLKG